MMRRGTSTNSNTHLNEIAELCIEFDAWDSGLDIIVAPVCAHGDMIGIRVGVI